MSLLRAVVIVSLAAFALGEQAHADSATDFYRGKQVTMIIPSDVGGGYDLYARFLAQYMGAHIPGHPKIVPQNMPGAGGLVAANYLYSQAPPDGLTFGEMQNTITLNQLIGSPGARFDVSRFKWIGSMSTTPTICLLSGKAKTLTTEDLFHDPVTIGADVGSATMIPHLLNDLGGTRFNIVEGYPGSADVQLAMSNGEVDGICGLSWDGARLSAKSVIATGKAKVMLDIAIQPDPELNRMGVPFFMNFLPAGDKKNILEMVLSTQVYNRPFTLPPGVSDDKAKILQDAFKATVEDPAIMKKAENIGLQLQYLSAQQIDKLINLVIKAPVGRKTLAVQELKKAGLT
jgi:hypothetical protein